MQVYKNPTLSLIASLSPFIRSAPCNISNWEIGAGGGGRIFAQAVHAGQNAGGAEDDEVL